LGFNEEMALKPFHLHLTLFRLQFHLEFLVIFLREAQNAHVPAKNAHSCMNADFLFRLIFSKPHDWILFGNRPDKYEIPNRGRMPDDLSNLLPGMQFDLT
jgi:hypothetical protein